jgi:hypothetical protein
MNTDEKINILYNIDDMKELSRMCRVNTSYNNICKTKHFWSLYFNKYNLPLPPYNYKTSSEWIKSFIVSVETLDILSYTFEHQVNITDVDGELYLTGNKDNDRKIYQFVNNNSIIPYFMLRIFKNNNNYFLGYEIYDEDQAELIDILTIKLDDVKDVYYVIYNLLYNDIEIEDFF